MGGGGDGGSGRGREGEREEHATGHCKRNVGAGGARRVTTMLPRYKRTPCLYIEQKADTLTGEGRARAGGGGSLTAAAAVRNTILSCQSLGTPVIYFRGVDWTRRAAPASCTLQSLPNETYSGNELASVLYIYSSIAY